MNSQRDRNDDRQDADHHIQGPAHRVGKPSDHVSVVPFTRLPVCVCVDVTPLPGIESSVQVQMDCGGLALDSALKQVQIPHSSRLQKKCFCKRSGPRFQAPAFSQRREKEGPGVDGCGGLSMASPKKGESWCASSGTQLDPASFMDRNSLS